MTRSKFFALKILLSAIFLTGCVSLAEDITPPPGYQPSTPLPQPTAVPLGPVYPDSPPDPGSGAATYAEKCAPCHGDTGMGDGPNAAQLEFSVAALGSPELARQSTPADWYQMVTNGNIQKFMPPFNSLSDQERWDVVAYALTLSAPDEAVARGQALYLENCAECHGEDGRQGEVDFTDQETMSALSAADLFETISAGRGEMPAFGNLEEGDRWALTAYLRSLTFASSQGENPTGIAEGEAEPQESTGPSEIPAESPLEEAGQTHELATVNVRVISPAGAEIPPDLTVTLRGYDNMTQVITQTATTDSNDLAVFENVQIQAGRIYFATLDYANAAYGTDVMELDGSSASYDMDLAYYEPTNDPSILNVERLHVFIDFTSETAIQIYQLYVFSNPTDQVLAPAESDQPAVNFSIPAGALNFNVEDSMNLAYMKTPDGFGIASVYPGPNAYQTLFSFELPYENHKLDLNLPVGLDANAVIVMVPADGVKIKSDQLTDGGVSDFEGTSFSIYSGGNLKAGENLSFSISGLPKTGASFITTGGASSSLVIGLAGLGLALIVVGVVLWRRQRAEAELPEADWEEDFPEETTEDLMDAIIALDDQYKNGDLPEGAYRSRRAELKEKLRELVG